MARADPLRTDAGGRVRFSGWLGDYEVAALGRTAHIRLDGPAVRVEARLEGAD